METFFNPDEMFSQELPGIASYNVELSPEYFGVVEQIAPGLIATATTQQSSGESTLQTLIRAASTVIMTDYQRRLLNVQLDRASQGLPPLDMSQYGVSANVNVGVSADVQKLMIIGGVALVGVMLFMRKG